jgi:hypothetical protein
MYVYVCTTYWNPNVGACRHAKHTKPNFNKFQHAMLKFVEICWNLKNQQKSTTHVEICWNLLKFEKSTELSLQREHFRGPPEVFPRRLLVSLKHTHTHTHGSIVLATRNHTSWSCSHLGETPEMLAATRRWQHVRGGPVELWFCFASPCMHVNARVWVHVCVVICARACVGVCIVCGWRSWCCVDGKHVRAWCSADEQLTSCLVMIEGV